ncbi:hypothetical protein SAMN06295937_1011129 [Sphingopyxis flava]|uniref:Uncharacterized protein n=1 Tax=Sphingopyxis flava TaxID=1507287 RepID=A0A1T5CUN0_9SPHN|nr:hypothetical protein SAMN06295937_1011129 [Sphingopyxis flava]
MNYQVTIDLRVDDKKSLYYAARQSYMDEQGVHPGDIFGDENDVDVTACLVQLLDPSVLPGVTIYESSAEPY